MAQVLRDHLAFLRRQVEEAENKLNQSLNDIELAVTRQLEELRPTLEALRKSPDSSLSSLLNPEADIRNCLTTNLRSIHGLKINMLLKILADSSTRSHMTPDDRAEFDSLSAELSAKLEQMKKRAGIQ